jgi:predicted nucleic acid-binding protein
LNAYVDSSVILRLILGEPGSLSTWGQVQRALSSELTRLECLRTIDRARLRLSLVDHEVARLRADVLDLTSKMTLVDLDRTVLSRASEPFPTSLRSLDAIHLASADLSRGQVDGLRFATHDVELATAALSLGFDVDGIAR